MPNSRHIVIAITGGIAAYKSLSLIRLFKKSGAEVKVIATEHALQFVTPLSLQTLSQNSVYSDMFTPIPTMDVEHISLAEWADCVVVAPATANIMGKFAHGIADDCLTTFLLAYTKTIVLAPAMNHRMWTNTVVQENKRILQERGCLFIEPAEGGLACGVTGIGRMREPEEIFDFVTNLWQCNQPLLGKYALVTAGPTYEPIDPVRFIGNHSSGKMGYALADALASCGAQVVLVSGPTTLSVQHPNIQRIDVQTAAQMNEVCQHYCQQMDIIVMSAAVADYTPVMVAEEKVKKQDDYWNLSLCKTVDILETIGQQRTDQQCIVGFALETENALENAQSKLKKKNIDIIVLNSLRDPGAGFRCDTNKVTIIDKRGNIVYGELKNKKEVASDIVSYLLQYMNN